MYVTKGVIKQTFFLSNSLIVYCLTGRSLSITALRHHLWMSAWRNPICILIVKYESCSKEPTRPNYWNFRRQNEILIYNTNLLHKKYTRFQWLPYKVTPTTNTSNIWKNNSNTKLRLHESIDVNKGQTYRKY